MLVLVELYTAFGVLSRAASQVSNSTGVKVVRDAAYVRNFSFRRCTNLAMSLPEVPELISNRAMTWLSMNFIKAGKN